MHAQVFGQEGEFFKLHGDYSTSGTRSSAGFIDSSRLATVFVYLNDINQGLHAGG